MIQLRVRKKNAQMKRMVHATGSGGIAGQGGI